MKALPIYIYVGSKLIGNLPRCFKAKRLQKANKIEELENYIMPRINLEVGRILKKSGVTVDAIGLEKIPQDENVVFICNHQGNYDGIVFLATIKNRRVGFIGKKELEKVKILSIFMDLIGGVFVDRSNPRSALKSIEQAIKNVKAGQTMAFFPEGTRSKCSEVGEFKKGVFKIVEKTKVKVVPIAINGTYKILEQNKGEIMPTEVTFTVCDPIDTSEYAKEDFKNLPEMVRNIIIENMR